MNRNLPGFKCLSSSLARFARGSAVLLFALAIRVTVAAEPADSSTWEPIEVVDPRDAGQLVESEFVVVTDGHLAVDGQRQRYWAVIGKLWRGAEVKPGDDESTVAQKVALSRRGTDVLVARYEDLGFNAVRLWDAQPHGAYTPGDGSTADSVDYFVARLKQRGFRIWYAGLNRVGELTPEDVDIIDDPDTAEAWTAAVREAGGKMDIRNNPARIWDERIEAIGLARMKALATHYNPYTGLRYCDDPVFAVWELSNEEWWMKRMLGGSWQELPPFFRNSLIAKWNAFLLEKYGTESALLEAWGELLEGETLSEGTILFAPMAGATPVAVSINDAGGQANQAVQNLEQDYSREDFGDQRASDVLEFMTGLLLSHKQRSHAALKPLGRSTQLSPWIYDTGIGYEAQSQYIHQHADAVAHDAYINGVGRDKWEKVEQAKDQLQRDQFTLEAEKEEANDGRWNNWLLKPPGIAQGVPWLEHNKAPGMPYLCYETQIQQPAKYRADFPLRLAALASIQDWDWICWHYFGPANDVGEDDRPFDRPLDITTGGHPQGYHYTFDEVQNATMRAAAWMWRNQAFEPAPSPTLYLYGSKTLYDPRSMDYGGSYGHRGMNMLQTVYEHGVRIWIDPSRETDAVVGPEVTFAQRNTHNPYQPTDQIQFDWQKGTLTFDAPAGVAFAGLLSNVGTELTFRHDVTVRDVTINNPEGIFAPITQDLKYVAFSLYSIDGKPLAETQHASLSLVSTSFNSGFKLGGNGVRNQRGELPVLVARVGGVVKSPAIDGMTYVLRDWHLKEIGRGVVKNGELRVPDDKPVFVVDLMRSDDAGGA